MTSLADLQNLPLQPCLTGLPADKSLDWMLCHPKQRPEDGRFAALRRPKMASSAGDGAWRGETSQYVTFEFQTSFNYHFDLQVVATWASLMDSDLPSELPFRDLGTSAALSLAKLAEQTNGHLSNSVLGLGIEDSIGRFQLWVGNIGALQFRNSPKSPGHSLSNRQGRQGCFVAQNVGANSRDARYQLR